MFKNVVAVILLLTATVSQGVEFSDEECLDCHGVESFAVPSGKHGEGPKRSLGLNDDAFYDSSHGKLTCVECHTGIKKLPHKKGKLGEVDCIDCHIENNAVESTGNYKRKKSRRHKRFSTKVKVDESTRLYVDSIHANKNVQDNAHCSSCHTAHYVYPADNPKSTTYRENSPEMCGECHEKSLKEYKRSIHGAALKTPWKGKSATCSDCHSAHEITKSKELDAHRVVTKNCGDCHEKEVASYLSATHGQLAWLGNKDVPRCVDCHRGHDTHRIDDPESKVSKQNKLETCRECHEDASASIVKYKAHGNTSNFDRYPAMWITGKLMILIVVLVLIFFYSHSLLWFYREYKNRVIASYTQDSLTIQYRVKPEKKHGNVHYRRFAWYWRLNHWALALSVMTLVLTGMAVMYPDTDWAMAIVTAMGGSQVFGTIHRTAGVVFLTAVFGHGLAVVLRIRKDKDFKWFGPDSLLPRKKDWEDMKGQFLWFFNKGEEPKFDRWAYWEKFDYWAVYWGAFVIGSSGVILWASPFLLRFMPGWVFNIASIAHGVEAFLAVTTLFVVHFFNNHFRPAKFPLDTVMFSGSWDLEEFREERPLEYERLKLSGELEKRLVKPPSKMANILYHIFGFTLLGIGIGLLVLVLIGFNTRGFV